MIKFYTLPIAALVVLTCFTHAAQACDKWTSWNDSSGKEHTVVQPDGSSSAYHSSGSGFRQITNGDAEKLIKTATQRGRNVKSSIAYGDDPEACT